MTAASAAFVAGTAAGEVHLRILATSDLHACLLPFDYFTDRPLAALGLARTAELIAAARAEVPNCLLLDNGDFLQGTPLADYLAQRRRRAGPHPVIAAFNALGYDAGTLGNHEFNFGLDYLHRVLADARHPVVSANIVRHPGPTPDRDETLVPPYALLTRQMHDGAGRPVRLTIGVIGFSPPQTLTWDRQHLVGRVSARDIPAAARAWVPVMRARGADVVIALSHSGIGPATETEGMENASTVLAAVPGIDAVIAGHSHLAFPALDYAPAAGVDPLLGTLAGKPAVLPGHSGSHLGVIDLALAAGPDGWRVAAHATHLRGLQAAGAGPQPAAMAKAGRQARAAVQKAVGPAHRAARAWARRSIGQTTAPLSTHFAQVAGSAAMTLVAEAQRDHVARALQGHPAAELPLLSAVSPFKCGGRGGPDNYTHVPAGDLARRHAADLYVFPNMIAALRLTGAQLRDWLDRAAGQFHHIPAGSADAELIDPAFPAFNFDQILGLSYAIDLAVPPVFSIAGDRIGTQSRIRDLCHDGRPLNPAAEFVLATNSYRANGSGLFAGAGPDRMLDVGHGLVRDILVAHVAARGIVSPASGPDWRLVAAPGTSVVFQSHLQADGTNLVPQLRLQPLGPDAAGFGRFRLQF